MNATLVKQQKPLKRWLCVPYNGLSSVEISARTQFEALRELQIKFGNRNWTVNEVISRAA